jgi:hypothetical protein
MTADGNRAGKVSMHLMRLAGDRECNGVDGSACRPPCPEGGQGNSLDIGWSYARKGWTSSVTPSLVQRGS